MTRKPRFKATFGLAALGLAGVAVLSGALSPAAAPLEHWKRFSVLTEAGPLRPDPGVVRRLKPLIYVNHVISRGEYSVWTLAKEYGTTAQSIQATNNNELILMSPGQSITIPNKKGLLYFVQKDGETLDSVVSRYEKKAEKAKALKERAVEANGLPGTALLASFEFSKGEVLLLPGASVSFDNYVFPFKNPGWHRVSSRFGRRRHPILKYVRQHDGWDLPQPRGTPVYPSRSGRVIYAGWKEGYGNMVEVRHPDGASTVYGHLAKINAVPGEYVQRNKSLLGKVGSTGLSTGPHLHFEVRDRHGRAVNPGNKIGRR